jgi:type IV pilus assembly protein PilF
MTHAVFPVSARLPALLLCLAAAGWLAGCAGSPRATADGTPISAVGAAQGNPELYTEVDEPEARQRARVRLELAAGYYEQGQFMVALDEVKRSLAADPTFGPAYNLRGLIHRQINEPRLAEADFREALRRQPRDADSMHNLGVFYCDAGRYAEANALFARAVEVPAYQNAATSWMMLGICQARAGNSEEARRSLARSFELDAGNPITTFNLALLLHQAGDHTRAQFYIRRLNNSELANAQSLWLGMQVEHALNNREVVRQLSDQLRRRFPDSQEWSNYQRNGLRS